jgi:hypothetical protein
MSWSCSVAPRRVVGSNPVATDFLRGLDRNNVANGNHNNGRSAALANRSRLSWTLVVHFIFVLLMAFRLSVAIYVFAGIRPPRLLQRIRLPAASNWEFSWFIGSAVTCFVGLLAVKRRKSVLVRVYIALSLLAGILPVIYAAVFHVSHDLIAYWNTHHTRLVFHGIPVVIIWSMFLAAALQLHTYGIYFAYCLLKAWKAARLAANQPIKTPTL